MIKEYGYCLVFKLLLLYDWPTGSANLVRHFHVRHFQSTRCYNCCTCPFRVHSISGLVIDTSTRSDSVVQLGHDCASCGSVIRFVRSMNE